MTLEDLENLKTDLQAVRKAIDRHSPLFREVASSSFLSALSLPYAILVLAFGIGTQLLVEERGGFDRLPDWWITVFWIVTFLVLVIGGVVKVIYLRRRAANVGAGLWDVVSAVWGNDWFHVNVSGALTLIGVSVFAVIQGHAWFILPAATIYFGLALNSLGFIVRRLEYFVSGWYGVAAGTISLFSLERAPWLWLGVLIGGLLLIYGVVGLLPRGESATRAKEGRE
jgi:hypothetical protein